MTNQRASIDPASWPLLGRASHGGLARVLLLAAGVASAGVLVGCDRESAAHRAVVDAARDVHALTGGGSAPETQAARTATLQRVASALEPVAGSSAPEKGAASLLLAQAHGGLALEPIANALSAERSAREKITQGMSSVSAWTLLAAEAAAAEAYDPAAELAQVDAIASRAAQGIARVTQERDAVRAQVAQLSTSAAALEGQAAAALDQYAALVAESQRVSATQGLALMERAREQRRIADGFNKQAGEIRAQSVVVEPRVAELEVELASLEAQRADAQSARARLEDRRAQAQARARDARGAASALAGEIDALVAEIVRERSEVVGPAHERAQGVLNKAATSARGAAHDLKAGGNGAAGIARQVLGDLAWHRAGGHAMFATFLESLAATPGLPKASEYGARAREEREAERAALQAATEAFDQAKAGLSAAGVQSTREALAQASADVEALALMTGGSAADLAAARRRVAALAAGEVAPEAAPSDPSAAAASGINPADDAAIRAAFDAAFAAALEGRWDDLRGLWHAPTPEVASVLMATSKLNRAILQLDAGLRGKFNVGMIDAFRKVPQMGPMLAQQMEAQFGGADLSRMASLKGSQIEGLTITGDEATGTIPGWPMPAEFIRVDGQWKMRSVATEQAAAMMSQMLPMIEGQIPCFESLITRVNAGEFADVDAFAAAVMPALAGCMGGGAPGGGAGSGG